MNLIWFKKPCARQCRCISQLHLITGSFHPLSYSIPACQCILGGDEVTELCTDACFYKKHPSLSSWSVAKRLCIPGLKCFKAVKAARKKATRQKNDGTLCFYPVYKVKRQTSLTPLHEGLHIHLLFYILWRLLERLLSFWRASMLFSECIIGEWASSLCCGCTPAVGRRSNTNTTLRDKKQAATDLWIGHSWELKSDCHSRSS